MRMTMSTKLGRVATAAFFFAFFVGAGSSAFAQDPVGERMEQAKRSYRSGNYRAALSELQSISTEAPDRADVFYLIGYCQLMMRQYTESIDSFARAFELDPSLDPRTIYHPELAPPE